MTLKQESRFIKDIQTHLLLISKFSTNNNSESKKILVEFCNKLSNLSNNYKSKSDIIKYINKTEFTPHYYETPFLWFSVDFFNLILNYYWIRKSPIVFILKILRKVTRILKKDIAFNKIDIWEGIQYECNKDLCDLLSEFNLDAPLIPELNYLLKKNLRKNDIDLLYLNNKIKDNFPSQRGYISKNKRFKMFLNLTGTQICTLYYPQAFLLSWVYIDLEIKDKSLFWKFLNLENKNSSLISSTSFLLCNKSINRIFGWIVIPNNTINNFKWTLSYLEKKGVIFSNLCEEIIDYSESLSYNFYKHGRGWEFPNNKLLLKTKFPETKKKNFMITSNWNKNWNIQMAEEPQNYIKQLSSWWGNKNWNEIMKFTSERNVFDLIKNRVIQTLVIPYKLLFFLVPHMYIIEFKNSDSLIKRMRKIVPYSSLLTLKNEDKKILIFHSPKSLEKRLIDHQITFYPVRIKYSPQKIVNSFFNEELNIFRPPEYLKRTN